MYSDDNDDVPEEPKLKPEPKLKTMNSSTISKDLKKKSKISTVIDSEDDDEQNPSVKHKKLLMKKKSKTILDNEDDGDCYAQDIAKITKDKRKKRKVVHSEGNDEKDMKSANTDKTKAVIKRRIITVV